MTHAGTTKMKYAAIALVIFVLVVTACSVFAQDATIAAGETLHRDVEQYGLAVDEQHVVEWDFGDAKSVGNVMRGFNSAHVYEAPGTYRLQLRDGATIKGSTIVVTKSTRKRVDVKSESQLLAAAKLSSVDIVLSDNLVLTKLVQFSGRHVVLYGGNHSITWNGARDGTLFAALKQSSDVTVRDLLIDGTNSGNTFSPAGIRLSLINIAAASSGYFVNGNMKPDGVLVQSCFTVDTKSVRKYFSWSSGRHYVFSDCTVSNAINEHCIRSTSDSSFIAISSCDLQNVDEQRDRINFAKGTLTLQVVRNVYVDSSVFRLIGGDNYKDFGADLATGPHPDDGKRQPGVSTSRVVIERSTFTNGAQCLVRAGSHNERITDNRTTFKGRNCFNYSGSTSTGLSKPYAITFARNVLASPIAAQPKRKLAAASSAYLK